MGRIIGHYARLIVTTLCFTFFTLCKPSNAFILIHTHNLQDVIFHSIGQGRPAGRRLTDRKFLGLSNSLVTDQPNEVVSPSNEEPVERILIVGDGDLSFSAELAKSCPKISITATVLESKCQHREVYTHSESNEKSVLSVAPINQNQVLYEVDATKLHKTFVLGRDYFDEIRFNFPHWRGKSNHKRNRQLLLDVFSSTKDFIRPETSITRGGILKIALVSSQGDVHAKTLQEFRETWMPTLFANQEGWILKNVDKFQVHYRLSSHRGVDRGFRVGTHPEVYSFQFVGVGDIKNIITVDDNYVTGINEEYQLCCRHELHIVLPLDWDDTSNQDDRIIPIKNIVEEDAVQKLAQGIIPPGIKVRVPARSFLPKQDTGYDRDMMVFLIVYCGENLAITRDSADSFRDAIELEVGKHVALRENRRGRLVSRPFLYPLLDSIMEDHIVPVS